MNLQHLTNCANTLLAQMQSILEDRDQPIIESNHNDFYKIDCEYFTDWFAPGLRYLFRVGKYGTHLSVFGLCDLDQAEWPSAITHVFDPDHVGYASEWYIITVAENGMSRIKLVDYKKACSEVTGPRFYRVEGSSVYRTSASRDVARKVGAFDSKTISAGPGLRKGVLNLAVENDATRGDIIALWQRAHREVIRQTGTLFTKIESTTINGNKELRDICPRLTLDELVPGRFARQAADESAVA